MIMQVRKAKLRAPWIRLGTRCIVGPVCCNNSAPIPIPCGGPCDWSLPSTLFLTFTGQTRIPNGSYELHHVSDGSSFGSGPESPGWVLGGVDLLNEALFHDFAGGTLVFGPKYAQFQSGSTYFSMFVVPTCVDDGVTLTVYVSVVNLAPVLGLDGFISGYTLAGFPQSSDSLVGTTPAQGYATNGDCTDLLPYLDVDIPSNSGALSITA